MLGAYQQKPLINTANIYRKLQHADQFGLKLKDLSVDMKALLKRKEQVVAINTGGIDALFKANGIDALFGEAEVTAPGKIALEGETIAADKIIIATGGRPIDLPGLELDGKVVIGSSDALAMADLPKRIAVIGAGALGAEFACIWEAFGVEVTLIEAMPTLLPREDEELAKRMASALKKRGMDVRPGTKVTSLKRSKSGAKLELEGKRPGTIEVDKVLVAIGSTCNSEVVSAKGLGVKLDGPRNAIVVNDKMETSVPGIYAIGDVINRTWLAHGASNEGIVAATNATGGTRRMNYRVLPSCNFTTPEVASVGLTEQAAKDAGISTKTGKFLFSGNGRAHALGETEGMVKIVGDATSDELLGVHIMGPEAGEMIATAALAMSMEATVEEIVETIHTHPTLSEALLEAAEDYYGQGIHSRPKK